MSMRETSQAAETGAGRILLVGAGRATAAALAPAMEARGWRVAPSADWGEAAAQMPHLRPDVVVGDAIEAAEVEGCRSLLAAGRRLAAPPAVIAMTPDGREVEPLRRAGATHAPEGRAGVGELLRRISLQFERRRADEARREGSRLAARLGADFLIGDSAAFRQVVEQIELIAGKETTVLVSGETGTGKERVARAIHALSGRAARPLVSVNCGGIPAHLLEDEFFGHVRGAFTDAYSSRVGRFEQADGGTLFLDEIGDLPLELQPKLLRAVQEREIHRVGGVEPVPVDVRIVAATHADLTARVEDGRFREDLFYRINVFHIELPPLRERPGDVPAFIASFLEKFCRRDGLTPKRLDPAAEADLAARAWPGNVRELENAVEIAVIRSGERRTVDARDFPASRRPPARAQGSAPGDAAFDGGAGVDLKQAVARFERNVIERALERSAGNKSRAAESLRIKRTTLIEKLKRLERELGVAAG